MRSNEQNAPHAFAGFGNGIVTSADLYWKKNIFGSFLRKETRDSEGNPKNFVTNLTEVGADRRGRGRRHAGGFAPQASHSVNHRFFPTNRVCVFQNFFFRSARVLEFGSPRKEAASGQDGGISRLWKSEKKHLFDGASPNVTAGRGGRTLESHRVLFLKKIQIIIWSALYPTTFMRFHPASHLGSRIL